MGHAPGRVGRWWPSTGRERAVSTVWLPKAPFTLRDAVDNVSRKLLGRRASSAMIKASAQLTKTDPDDVAKTVKEFGEWRANLVVSVVLNSPEHLRK